MGSLFSTRFSKEQVLQDNRHIRIVPDGPFQKGFFHFYAPGLLHRKSKWQSIFICLFASSEQLVLNKRANEIGHSSGMLLQWDCQIWTVEVSRHVNKHRNLLTRFQRVRW